MPKDNKIQNLILRYFSKYVQASPDKSSPAKNHWLIKVILVVISASNSI
jgi:hypothetical protein